MMTNAGELGRARATATRIFRSPRGSFIRAIATSSSPSTVSRAPPTISPITRRPAPDEKLRLLEEMRRTMLGETDAEPTAVALRAHHGRRAISARSMRSIFSLRFRRDVTKLRYGDWDDLMDYCRYSAMPVGRFVLDVHGEARATWPASDALCSALQVVNHLQDCGKDYRNLDRVYIPLDTFAAAGTGPEALGEARASPALLRAIAALAKRNAILLTRAKPFAAQIRDLRLALEVGVIQRLAEDLNRRLLDRDPLSERVHHRKSEAIACALSAVACFFGRAALAQIGAAGHRRRTSMTQDAAWAKSPANPLRSKRARKAVRSMPACA